MVILYSYCCGYTGLIYRCRVVDVVSVVDEPYPPGGMLRVCRNARRRMLAAPLVSEILTWEVSENLKD